jgi:hypothetical protein
MSDADITYIESELRKTTSPGDKLGKWPPTSGHWGNAYARLESLRSAPTPPPTPPPTTGQLLDAYLDPEGDPSSYADEFDACKAAIPGTHGAMAPMDASFVNHVGVDGQIVLVPAGCTAARFNQYGLPCWQTGKVAAFVAVDEPGSDPTSLALIHTVASFIRAACTGTNSQGDPVKIAVTQFAAATLTALAASPDVDILANDCYPMRAGNAAWTACNAACDAALKAGHISEWWTVLDAFEAPNYPAPSQAQLEAQIVAAQTTSATRLINYAWGQAGGTPQAQLPGVVAALNTIG